MLAAAVALSLLVATVPAVALEASVVPRSQARLPQSIVQPQRHLPSGIRTLAADDDIPGIPLPVSPFMGWLNTTDVSDVYSVYLGVGDTLSVSITGPANTYMDVDLYQPGSTTIFNATNVIYTTDSVERSYVYPFGFDFKVDPSQGYSPGTYYLDAWFGAGGGAYTVTWRIIPEDGDNDIPDALPLLASPLVGWATSAWLWGYPDTRPPDRLKWKSAYPGTLVDGSDVRSIDLAEGDQLIATVSTTDRDLGMELLLYPPHASNVNTDTYVYYDDARVASTNLASVAMPESLNFVVPPGGAGGYFLSAEAWAGSGDYTLTWSTNQNAVVRMSGATRYETGQAIVRSTSHESTVAILASGAGYADALSAAGLAGAYNAPLLLTSATELPDAVSVQLVEMGVEKVIIVGGTGAVSAGVATTLVDGGFIVERLAGVSRYATSAACATAVHALVGTTDAFVVRGDSFADALAVSPFAYTQKAPVLLTEPASLPTTISAFLETNDVVNVYIAGGTGAVSSGVASAIDRLNGGATMVERVAGKDRYETARDVADFGVGKGWNSYAFVGVSTGANFPDALAGGVACGRMGGVLLLTTPTTLSPPASAAIAANKATIERVGVFGGTGALSLGVFAAIRNLLTF
ncbi:MAG: cell wall-binding [Actinobacteria bacterium]|nr:MAG: cell wall-binding [Actinomycetota bacterium]